MDCKFAEKVSLLMDGELPSAEKSQVKAHLAECADCRRLESDFLFFRRQIKEDVPVAATAVKGRKTVEPVERKNLFWGRRILLPAPAFVLLLFTVAALAIWALTGNLDGAENSVVGEDSGRKISSKKPPLESVPGEISLSRFDHGGRAEIYTVRRDSANLIQKTESSEQ